MINFFGGSHGPGVPWPNFMNKVVVQTLKARPPLPAQRASQNQTRAGDAISGLNFESCKISRITAGIKKSTVPGSTITAFISFHLLFGVLRWYSPSPNAKLPG